MLAVSNVTQCLLLIWTQAEFSLLDEPLIRAIVSDQDPDQLYSRLDDIRDDLGLLQASVVPDPDTAYYQNVGTNTTDADGGDSSSHHFVPTDDSLKMFQDEKREGGSTDHALLRELSLLSPTQPLKDPVEQLAAHTPSESLTSAVSPVSTREAALSSSSEPSDTTSLKLDVYEKFEDDQKADLWYANPSAEDGFGPLDFLYEMFSHLCVILRLPFWLELIKHYVQATSRS
jgi:hypothetical protein